MLTLQTNNHTSPKTAPGPPPPPRQPRTRAATAIAPAICLTIVTRKSDGTMQTSVKSCARGCLDVQVGVETAQMTTCRGRGGVWSAIRVEGGAGEGWSSHLFSRLVAVTASQYARPRRGKGSRGGNPSLACHTRHQGHPEHSAAMPTSALFQQQQLLHQRLPYHGITNLAAAPECSEGHRWPQRPTRSKERERS